MSYSIFTGKQRSLVFPVMCNAFATIDYAENIVDTDSDADTSNDITYGLWNHEGDFTFECIITPYDINGYGSHITSGYTAISSDGNLIPVSNNTYTDTKKIMPAINEPTITAGNESNYESELYLSRASRLTHEMRIFHSSNFQISLVNDTLHNHNQPAQYKIKVGVKLGSASIEYFESDVVISANDNTQYFYSTSTDITGFDDEGRLVYNHVCSVVSSGTAVSGSTINVSSTPANDIFGGDKQEIFYFDGTDFVSLGTVSSITSSTIVLTSTPTVTINNSDRIYVKYALDPIYINNLYHIACSWSDIDHTLQIFLNGNLVKTATHTQTDTFSLARENFYLGSVGSNTTGSGSASTNKQFMGEMHEMSIENIRKTRFSGTYNLLPTYNNTLLYLRFEEVDE